MIPAGHPHAGWIYVGISRTNGKPFYAASRDAGVFKWKQAMAFAAAEKARLPTAEELNQMYALRSKGALNRTFNVTRSGDAGCYWSNEEEVAEMGVPVTLFGNTVEARGLRFSDGLRLWMDKGHRCGVRLVRS